MLELQHVSVEFASEHSVLAVDDISMQLEKGTRTAIVGETGSGKSVGTRKHFAEWRRNFGSEQETNV